MAEEILRTYSFPAAGPRNTEKTLRAAIECAVMAADAGAVPVDEDIIAIAGTGKGADSAIVIRTANQNRFFDMKMREIITMPDFWFRSARPPCGVSLPPLHGASLRIASLRHEAKDSWPLASSPLQADAPRTSIRVLPIHEPVIPLFQHSIIPC